MTFKNVNLLINDGSASFMKERFLKQPTVY